MQAMTDEGGKILGDVRIEVCRKGPYRVIGGVPLSTMRITTDAEGYAATWTRERDYPVKPEYILCRCGRSLDKPFCDGIHEKIHFIGTESWGDNPYLSIADRIEGPSLRLTDALVFCASARFCDRAGGIWSLTEQSGNEQARETAIEEAKNCPSGRLVEWEKGTGQALEPTLEKSIGVVEYPMEGLAGPLWVRGGIPVFSVAGHRYEVRNRVTLCRCGHSFNKPFCDSSHLRWSGNRPLPPMVLKIPGPSP